MFWSDYNRKRNKSTTHLKDGRWWGYNTLSAWEDDFAGIKQRTIQKQLLELEDMNLIFSRQDMNEHVSIQTKWYSPNLEAIEVFLEIWFQLGAPLRGERDGDKYYEPMNIIWDEIKDDYSEVKYVEEEPKWEYRFRRERKYHKAFEPELDADRVVEIWTTDSILEQKLKAEWPEINFTLREKDTMKFRITDRFTNVEDDITYEKEHAESLEYFARYEVGFLDYVGSECEKLEQHLLNNPDRRPYCSQIILRVLSNVSGNLRGLPGWNKWKELYVAAPEEHSYPY